MSRSILLKLRIGEILQVTYDHKLYMKTFTDILLCRICLLALISGTLILQGATERLQVPENISNSIRETAMPEMGNSQLEKLLARYYESGLGGSDIWNNIQSISLKGSLLLSGNEFEMLCYQRKPNRFKMRLDSGSNRYILGFDGEDAWQCLSGDSSSAIKMSPEAARRFIHSAVFGNYLLYPYRVGKKIEYLGTTREMDTVCHLVRVALNTGYVLDYYIDVRTFLDIKIVNYDKELGTSLTLMCEDFRRIEGFPVAHKIISKSDGGAETLLLINQVKFNLGLTDWIFKRPK